MASNRKMLFTLRQHWCLDFPGSLGFSGGGGSRITKGGFTTFPLFLSKGPSNVSSIGASTKTYTWRWFPLSDDSQGEPILNPR
jgi:hypothetical protein